MKKIKHILFQIGILTVLLSAAVSQAMAAFPSSTKTMTTESTDTCTVVVYDTVVVSMLQMPFLYADTIFDFGTPDSSIFVFHDVAANGCDSITNLLFLYRANYKQSCFSYYWPITDTTYTESGIYFHYYQNNLGELGIDTLFLTIYSPSVTIAPMQPVTVCQGANTEISATISGEGDLSYEWDGPYQNFSSTESSFSIVNASAIDSGSYTIMATATQGHCTATDTASVEVTVIPTPEVEISGNHEICYGENITLTVYGSGIYHWITGSSASTITVSPSMNTIYSVSVTGPNGCVGHADFPVTVHPLPMVTITGKSVICAGESVTLNASGADTYQWSAGNGNYSPTHTTTYSVTGTDNYGCTATASFTVTVNPLPHVSISGGGSICLGDTVTLNASGATSYVWSEGNGGDYTPSQTTTYSVTGTNAQTGCRNTATTTVTVLPLPNVRISGVGTICAGQRTLLTVSGATSYDWIGGNDTNYHASPAESYTYYVTGTDAETGCSNTAHKTVIVNPLPDVFIMGNREICAGQALNLTAGGATTYSWNHEFPDYPTENTTYTVTGTDDNQCKDTASVNVIVHNPQVSIIGTDSVCVGEPILLIAVGAIDYEWSDGSDNSYIMDTISATTVYSVMGTDEYGCTKTDTLQVFVGQGTEDTINVTACGYYFWPLTGDTLTASGIYFFNYQGANGCVSAKRLQLTIAPLDTTHYELAACEEYTWNKTGATYTQSGAYPHNYITPEGCPAVDLLHLTVNKGTHTHDTVSVCEHYIWPVNGYGYSVSDNYVFEYSDTNGCACSKTLHLTIKHGTHEEISATGYNSYTWDVNGETYTQSGYYVHHFTNGDSCDCTLTLNLTIKHNDDDMNCIQCVMEREETCPNGQDGAARVLIPNAIKGKCKAYWTKPDGSVEEGEVISGLSKGIYTVTVYAEDCSPVSLFEGVVVISKQQDCDVNVSISGPRNVTGGCNGIPGCTFIASAAGGTPPYYFHEGWEKFDYNQARRVFTPGEGHFMIGCIVTDDEGRSGRNFLDGYAKNMECAQDPNEIKGPIGFDDSLRYVNATDKMHYTIDFENDPEFAMAPATRVKITYDVPANQRMSSFRLSDFGFGDFVFTVPSNTSSYSQRLDVSDSLGVWVDVNAGIDVVNHQLFWIFQSIDPATGAEPVSSQMGFLPVNDSLEHGEGYVSFYIMPENGVQTGDTVAAEALIVFDDNAPIGTNVWRNTFDAVAPTSTLHAEINAQDSLYCTFSFTAQDDPGGSGVNKIEVFVSVNNSSYTSIGSCAPDSTLTYALENGLLYQFISIATDNVGNTEPFKATPDTTVNYNRAPFDLVLDGNSFYEETPLNTYIGTFLTLDADMNQHFTYELVNGEGSMDNNLFQIIGNELKTNSLFECSHRTEYFIRVKSTDRGGLSIEKAFVLTEMLVHGTPVTNTRATICQGESFNFNGMMLTTAGTYSDTLQSTNGCDSIVTLFLTVNPVYHINVTEAICEGGSFNFLGQMLTSAGTYSDTLHSVNGCDSIFTLNLEVYPHDSTQVLVEICEGDTYDFYGQTLSVAGTYTHTLQSMHGCDSVIILTLGFLSGTHNAFTETACDSFLWHNQTYTTTGTYLYDYTDGRGCASVDTLHLTILQSTHNAETETNCGSYEWHGHTYTETGTYIYHYTNADGCASADTLHLTVDPAEGQVYSVDACESYTWSNGNGQTYTNSGNYYYTHASPSGCYQTDVLRLSIYHSVPNVDVEKACESFEWHNQIYSESGVYTYTYTDLHGCITTDTLLLEVNIPEHQSYTVSASGSYTWTSGDGLTYSESGNYYYTHNDTNGCVQVDTLHLTISNGTFNSETETACDSYVWHGQTYTMSGTYTYSYTNSLGAPSVDTLHLTINNGTHHVETTTACMVYMWHDNAYTASGTYTYNYTSDNGCPGVDTLHLTIQQIQFSNDFVTICESELPYTYADSVFGIGTPAHTVTPIYLTTAEGCDSVVTLDLTVNPTFNIFVYDTAILGHEYVYDNLTITPENTGSYDYEFQYSTVDGCDSIIHLNLLVINNDGIPTVDLPHIEVFPNPAQTVLNIKGENMQKIHIYDAEGRLVFVKNENIKDLQQVDVSGFAAGQYFVKILLHDGQTVTFKFLVNRK